MILQFEHFKNDIPFTLVAEGFFGSIVCMDRDQTIQDLLKWVWKELDHDQCDDHYIQYIINDDYNFKNPDNHPLIYYEYESEYGWKRIPSIQCANSEDRVHVQFGLTSLPPYNCNLPSKYSCPVHKEISFRQDATQNLVNVIVEYKKKHYNARFTVNHLTHKVELHVKFDRKDNREVDLWDADFIRISRNKSGHIEYSDEALLELIAFLCEDVIYPKIIEIFKEQWNMGVTILFKDEYAPYIKDMIK